MKKGSGDWLDPLMLLPKTICVKCDKHREDNELHFGVRNDVVVSGPFCDFCLDKMRVNEKK